MCQLLPAILKATTRLWLLEERGRVPTAQNSFLPVAGATGSRHLTWMMLEHFGLLEEHGPRKRKHLNLLSNQGLLERSWSLVSAHL